MKKTVFILYALLLWVAGGCTDKEIGDADGSQVGGPFAEGKGYIAVNVVSTGAGGGSRAWSDDPAVDGDFDPGSEDESALCSSVPDSHWVLLFNDDGSFHSMSKLTGGTLSDPLAEEGHLNERSLGTFAAEVRIEGDEKVPAKCLVVLNARPARIYKLMSELEQSQDTWILPDGVTKASSAAQYVLMSLTRTLSDEDIKEGGSSVVLFTPGGLTGKMNYCTMSSVTYAEGESEGAVHTMDAIGSGNIAATEEEARNNPLTVHVERLAAKVEVEVPESAVGYGTAIGDWKDKETDGPAWPVVFRPEPGKELDQAVDPDGESVKTEWACVIWGWGTNAVARREYVFKNLNDAVEGADKAKTGTPHYVDETTGIGSQFFENWNDPARHRSYWAVDGYYADPKVYPMQYRHNYEENPDENSYLGKWSENLGNDGKRTENSPLYYYTYRELRLRALGFSPDDVTGSQGINGNLLGSRKFRYIPENVLGQELLSGNTYLAASTHVLFMGQLLLGDEVSQAEEKYKAGLSVDNLDEMMEWVKDKYCSGNKWYDKAGYMQRAYTDVYSAFDGEERPFFDTFGDNSQYTIPSGEKTLKAVKGEVEVELTGEFMKDLASKGDAALNGDENPFDLVPAEITNGDGRVLLGLKEGWTIEIKGTEGGATLLTLDNVKFKSASLTFFSEPADYYKNGRMYYYAPIRHARVTVDVSPSEYKTGDIGVVRNHWYRITVNSVLKPGIPVADPEQPIIPNIDPADQYLGLEVGIVPWHVVDQSVDLQ